MKSLPPRREDNGALCEMEQGGRKTDEERGRDKT